MRRAIYLLTQLFILVLDTMVAIETAFLKQQI
jgi:hypothetical protein